MALLIVQELAMFLLRLSFGEVGQLIAILTFWPPAMTTMMITEVRLRARFVTTPLTLTLTLPYLQVVFDDGPWSLVSGLWSSESN